MTFDPRQRFRALRHSAIAGITPPVAGAEFSDHDDLAESERAIHETSLQLLARMAEALEHRNPRANQLPGRASHHH